MFLAEDLSIGEWANAGRTLRDFTESKLWWIGDWRNYAERFLADHSRAVSEFLQSEMKYCAETVRKSAYVCKRFPPGNRFPLSFKHHMIVAPMTPEAQAKWLGDAIKNEWSASDLVAQIRQALKTPQAAAENENVDIFMWEDWIREGEKGFKSQIESMPLKKWQDALLIERVKQIEDLQKPLLAEVERRGLEWAS